MNASRLPQLISFLLEAGADGRDFTAREFAEMEGLSRETAHYLLKRAHEWGWVQRRPGKPNGKRRGRFGVVNLWRSKIQTVKQGRMFVDRYRHELEVQFFRRWG